MNIYINPLSDKGAPVLQAKPSGSPISQLRFKRGSSVPLTVTLLGVTEAGNLRIGMKRRDRFESPLLAYACAAEPDEAEEGAPARVRFTLMLHVNSEELDDALGVGAGDSVDVPGAVPALTEIRWEEGETTRISDSVATLIANDIVRTGADTPQSEQGAYPLPELLATKGWVNDLHAGAGQYGLVELESGAQPPTAEKTAKRQLVARFCLPYSIANTTIMLMRTGLRLCTEQQEQNNHEENAFRHYAGCRPDGWAGVRRKRRLQSQRL